MIGLFDSGHGGLTVLKAVAPRFSAIPFVYLGDHAHVPYGNRPSEEIVGLTRAGVEALFGLGCRLVLLACNTATAVAARTLQRDWLPASPWAGRHNLVGIIAPTVEAATQTPWAVTTPQYPQKYNTDLIAVFGTRRTIASGVFPEEIRKRCPKVEVVQQACPDLAGAIEEGRPAGELDALVSRYVGELNGSLGGRTPHRAILGCTHYPIVETHFRAHLPAHTRLLSQPEIVADSLEDYLARHPRYRGDGAAGAAPLLLTTGDPAAVLPVLGRLWPGHPPLERVAGKPFVTRS
jgi:glutamate racemase